MGPCPPLIFCGNVILPTSHHKHTTNSSPAELVGSGSPPTPTPTLTLTATSAAAAADEEEAEGGDPGRHTKEAQEAGSEAIAKHKLVDVSLREQPPPTDAAAEEKVFPSQSSHTPEPLLLV